MKSDQTKYRALSHRKTKVLKVHFFRTPKRAEVLELISDFKDLSNESPSLRSKAHLAIADLHSALGEALPTLEALSEVDLKNSSQAAARAGRVMAEIKTKKYNRVKQDYKAGAVKTAVARILKNSKKGYDYNKLKVYGLLFQKNISGALKAAGDGFKYDPVLATRDLANVVKTIISQFQYQDKSYFGEIGAVIGANLNVIKDSGGLAFIQGLREKFRNDEGKLQVLGLASTLSEESLAQFLKVGSLSEVLDFVNNKELFTYADAAEEDTKQLILETLRSRIRDNPDTHSRVVLLYLQKTSNTVSFWDNDKYRNELLDFVEDFLKGRDDYHAQMVLGISAFLKGDKRAAWNCFSACSADDSPFAQSGATSFLLEVSESDDADYLLDNRDIEFYLSDFTDDALVCCADSVYFRRYATDYMKSLRDVGSKARVHFHISGSKEDLKDLLDDLLAFAPVSFSFEPKKDVNPAYYASMRFLKAPLFIEKVASHVLLTDIDVSFRKDPIELIAGIRSHKFDIALRIYDTIRTVQNHRKMGLGDVNNTRHIYRFPRTCPWLQVNAACVCLTDSMNGRYAAHLMAKDMAGHLHAVLKSGKKAWWVDQNAIFYTYNQLVEKPYIKIGNVEDYGMPYGSFDYTNSTIIGGTSPILARNTGS